MFKLNKVIRVLIFSDMIFINRFGFCGADSGHFFG